MTSGAERNDSTDDRRSTPATRPQFPRGAKIAILFTSLIALSAIGRSVAPWSLQRTLLSYAWANWLFDHDDALRIVASLPFAACLLVLLRSRPFPRPYRFLASLRAEWFFTASALLLILAFRWPAMLSGELNPDESQHLAGAITLQADARYWVSEDGTSGGPLTQYGLLIPTITNAQPDYATARLTATLMLTAAAFCCGGILREWFGRTVGRLAITPAIAWLAMQSQSELLAYNSEIPCVLLTSAAGLLCVRMLRNRSALEALAAAVLLGMLPFAKVQAAPVAMAIALSTFLTMLAGRPRWRTPIVFVIGGFISLAIVLLYLAAVGQMDYAWKSYVLWPMEYADRTGLTTLQRFGSALQALLVATWSFDIFFATSLLSAGVGLIAAIILRQRKIAAGAAALALIFAATVYAIARPGNPFWHYFILLIPVLWIAAGAAWGLCLSHTRSPWMKAVFVAVALLLPIGIQSTRATSSDLPLHYPPPQLAAERWLNRLSAPPKHLAVWGWNSMWYIALDLPQATRDAQSYRSIQPGSLRDYFRAAWIADFDRTNPELFIDAVDPAGYYYTDRATQAHETFPELAARIAKRYDLTTDEPGLGRVYLRRDLIKKSSAESDVRAVK